MSLILVYISLAFAVVALVFMVLPLIGTRRERVRVEFIEEELRTIEALAAKRSALLQQLRDIEFDRETDKVSQEDYERFKRLYELQAVGVMRRLDEIRGGQNWDRLVDDELRKHLAPRDPDLLKSMIGPEDIPDMGAEAVASENPADQPDADVAADEGRAPEEAEETEDTEEVEDAEDREAAEDVADGELICGSCGTDLASDDRFCRKCGAPTPTAQDAAEASA